MIKSPVSASLECLKTAEIHHDLFISSNQCELHLWDADKLKDALMWLEGAGIVTDSIIRKPGSNDEGDSDFYIILF